MSKKPPTQAHAAAFDRIRALLREQESFPLRYTHKIIGKHSAAFRTGADRLLREVPGLRIAFERESSGGAHLAITFEFSAADADQVVRLLELTAEVEDLLVIL